MLPLTSNKGMILVFERLKEIVEVNAWSIQVARLHELLSISFSREQRDVICDYKSHREGAI